MDQIIIKPHNRRKRYSIEIDDDANIIVRTPKRSSKRLIKQLVDDHKDWIQRHQDKIHQKKESVSDWLDSNTIHLHGTAYQVFESDTLKPIHLPDRIHLPSGLLPRDFILSKAKRYLPERCRDIAEMMGLQFNRCRIKWMRRCWGTASLNKHISLNAALIQVPVWISDYVMIHECAHLVHFDHSSRFWALVAQYEPNYKQAKLWLKQHQVALLPPAQQ